MFKRFNIDSECKDVFLEEGLISAKVPLALAKSWQRSFDNRIDPRIEAAPVAKRDERKEFDHVLLKIAQPFFQYFSNLLNVDESVLVLSNSSGIILYVEVSKSIDQARKMAERHNLLVDANWSEEKVGTNAIGTAIIDRTNVLISGPQHYSYAWHPYSCAASPIFNPKTKEVIGAVNISSFYNKLHIHSLGWVSTLAKLIEKEFLAYWDRDKSKIDKNVKIFPIPKDQEKTSSSVIGTSSVFMSAIEKGRKAAQSHLNVLITGETGTGKEVLAKYIHDISNRRNGPFIPVNCAAIPKELVASELFGYVGGAFTGAARRGRKGWLEKANKGTLFLDEIGDAPYEVQVSLLRVLEEMKVYPLGGEKSINLDVRVISATSRNIADMITKDTFRRDLYYRLSGIVLDIPPLRERNQDIILLAKYFLNQYNLITSKNYILDQNLKELILDYDWPGNIRELKNVIERMAAMSDDEIITEKLFHKFVKKDHIVKKTKEDTLKRELLKTLKETKGNITLAAKLMGVNRTTVYRRMAKYGLCRKTIMNRL